MTGNPLDDAMASLDQADQRRAQAVAETARVAAESRSEMQALIDDFVGRMNRLGNPGTDWTGPKRGLFGSKLLGWSLTYESGDAWRRIPVTTDGRVPSFHPDRTGEYVRPIDSDFAPSKAALTKLTESMAEVLRRHS